jgi:hypothetical protein
VGIEDRDYGSTTPNDRLQKSELRGPASAFQSGCGIDG